jgi:hypothetical protein
MNKSDILTGFNNHIAEFFNDVSTIFPDDNDIKLAKTSLSTIRRMNPRLTISGWKENISDKYLSEIEAGNLDFFINRDYKEDLKNTDNSSSILDKIDILREPIKQMGEENKQKTIVYIQNLTKLCNLYHQ